MFSKEWAVFKMKRITDNDRKQIASMLRARVERAPVANTSACSYLYFILQTELDEDVWANKTPREKYLVLADLIDGAN